MPAIVDRARYDAGLIRRTWSMSSQMPIHGPVADLRETPRILSCLLMYGHEISAAAIHVDLPTPPRVSVTDRSCLGAAELGSDLLGLALWASL